MDWKTHLLHTFSDQAATWFVGVVLALLGVFSGKLVETIKLALNRADMRSKYYEELAVDLSAHVFAVNRLVKVYYGAAWATDDDKNAIAAEYNVAMNKLCSKEFVYRAWLERFWNDKMVTAYTHTMAKVRSVDLTVIRMNEAPDSTDVRNELEREYEALRKAAHTLLIDATR